MSSGPSRRRPAMLVSGFGAVLFVLSVGYHAVQALYLPSVAGPLVAGILAAGGSVTLVYAGFRLADVDIDTDERWLVFVWTVLGSALFMAVVGATLAVRLIENQPADDPVFPLLVSAVAGALAGYVAGYYNARSRTEARQARSASEALSFVNALLRHDLHNDLAVVQGQADLAADGVTDAGESLEIIAEKATEALGRIEASEAVARTLVDDAPLEPVEVTGLVGSLASNLQGAPGVAVRTDLPDRAFVTANAGLRSVVDNLLENAAEHNDADEPVVEVALEADAGTVRLVVRDNGPGIPEADRRTLLEGDGGDGGLDLVYTLVDRYGGSISVRDNDPRGTVVVVELPRASGGPPGAA